MNSERYNWRARARLKKKRKLKKNPTSMEIEV